MLKVWSDNVQDHFCSACLLFTVSVLFYCLTAKKGSMNSIEYSTGAHAGTEVVDGRTRRHQDEWAPSRQGATNLQQDRRLTD